MKNTSSNRPDANWLGKFRADEAGGITVFTLLLFISLFLVGGMAIDFLRFKSEQALVQDVSDRAVLAATKLESEVDPVLVVESYFAASGIEDRLVGVTTVGDSSVYREVSIEAIAGVDTFVLPLAGIDELSADLNSSAIQGIGDIEISLVLDVSFSMAEAGPEKINNLRAAAVSFAESALDPQYDGKISLSVIPYSGAVNIGPDMFAYLQGVSFTEAPGVQYSDTVIDEGATASPDDDTIYPADLAHCIDLEASDYTDAGLPGAGRTQTPHFLTAPAGINVGAGFWCPPGADIRYAQRVVGDTGTDGTLGHYLANLPLGYGTGTHDAIQYGLALLDPTSQPAFAHLSSVGAVDGAFAGRPNAYNAPGVQKVLVVMTDGGVWHTQTPNDSLNPDNLTIPVFNGQPNTAWTRTSDSSVNFAKFSAVCDLAKSPDVNVQVFTIAFETKPAQADVMRDCASSDGNFYETSGAGLQTVFGDIADQISSLRLTQ